MVGNLLATAIPRARIVPAVRGEDMSADAATVCDLSLPILILIRHALILSSTLTDVPSLVILCHHFYEITAGDHTIVM